MEEQPTPSPLRRREATLPGEDRLARARKLGVVTALLVAVVVISRFEGGAGSSRGAEQHPPLPTIPDIEGPVLQAPQCSQPGPFSRVCADINSLGGDVIESPASGNRLVRSRIVITPEGRVQYKTTLRMTGLSLGMAARSYDDAFEFYGWLLDPGSPPSGTLVAPRTEVTRHYVGVSNDPPQGTDSVPNKAFEATLTLKQVPPTRGGASDVLVDAVMQTIDPIPVPKARRR